MGGLRGGVVGGAVVAVGDAGVEAGGAAAGVDADACGVAEDRGIVRAAQGQMGFSGAGMGVTEGSKLYCAVWTQADHRRHGTEPVAVHAKAQWHDVQRCGRGREGGWFGARLRVLPGDSAAWQLVASPAQEQREHPAKAAGKNSDGAAPGRCAAYRRSSTSTELVRSQRPPPLTWGER